MDVGIIAGGMIGGAVILGQGRMVVTTIAVTASSLDLEDATAAHVAPIKSKISLTSCVRDGDGSMRVRASAVGLA